MLNFQTDSNIPALCNQNVRTRELKPDVFLYQPWAFLSPWKRGSPSPEAGLPSQLKLLRNSNKIKGQREGRSLLRRPGAGLPSFPEEGGEPSLWRVQTPSGIAGPRCQMGFGKRKFQHLWPWQTLTSCSK